MNTPNRPTREPQDHDIAALFDAQPVSVPDELDASILSAAKQAVALSTAPTKSTPEQSIKPLSKTTNRWFALAATVVVGISVAPVLLKAPESSLDAPAPVAITNEINAIRAEQDVQAASAPAQSESRLVEPESDNNGGAAGDMLLEESESSPASDESVNFAPVTPSALRTNSNNVMRKAVLANYRNTVDDWMKEIRRLESAGKTIEVSTEYKLFREKHPDIEPDFHPLSQSK